MKQKITYLSMAVALLFASCSQNEEITKTIEDERVAVRFSSNMASLETKAIDGTWNSHTIGISMLDTDGELIESDVQYKVTTSGGTSSELKPASTPLYYPTDGSNVSFIAYYPSSISDVNKAVKVENDTWTADLSNQNLPFIEQVDLLTATTTNTYNKKTSNPVSLSFEHRLAYVTIEITDYDDSYITSSGVQNMTVKLTNQPVTVHYGILTNKLSAEAVDTEGIILGGEPRQGSNNIKFRAIVYPGESNNSKFVFTIPSENLTFESDDLTLEAELPDVTFKPGTQYNYSVKLNYTPATAKFTASITDWKTVDMTDTTLEADEISE